MVICGNDLRELIKAGVITNVADELINAGSIDITCRDVGYVEGVAPIKSVIKLLDKDDGRLKKIRLPYRLSPHESILLDSKQVFNLPEGREVYYSAVGGLENGHLYEPIAMRIAAPSSPHKPAIFAEYKLKSTMARNFVDAYNAGWCDAGWNNARLTIELHNCNRWTSVIIEPGIRIGQMIFYYGSTHVEKDLSYRTKGRYNNTMEVTPAR